MGRGSGVASGPSPHAIARFAVDFVSGPGGLASVLRTGLLTGPYSTASLPLDIGYSQTIPAHIRRAVQLRDKTCAWPRCGRPAAHCDVHHLQHKTDGGITSVSECVLLCQFHQDVCIHRWGWRLVLRIAPVPQPPEKRWSLCLSHDRRRDHTGVVPEDDGWLVGQYDPLTPAGEAEQMDNLLPGMARQPGWRRVVARLAAVVVLLAIVAVIALEMMHGAKA